MTTKNKNARWGANSATPTIVLAGRDPHSHEMFGNKTLAQIGAKYDLSDEDVKWGYGRNPNNNEEIRNLMIKIENTWYQIPLSRNIGEESWSNPEVMLNCVFRVGFLSVKEEDGRTPKVDDKGKMVLADGREGRELQPYMSFGRIPGITVERMEDVFNEPVEGAENEAIADTTVGAGAAK